MCVLSDAPPVKKQKRGLRRQDAPPIPAEKPRVRFPVPDHKLVAGSSMQPCDSCGAHWDAKTREEIDGEDVPVYHRTFLVEDVEIPVYKIYKDVFTQRRTLDIWCRRGGGVLPIVIRRWLCPACFWREWDRGIEEYCSEQFEQYSRSPSAEAMNYLENHNLEIYESELEPEDETSLKREIAEFMNLPENNPRIAKFLNVYTRSAVE